MSDLAQLLVVQDLDIRSDQLTHRKNNLAERAARDDVQTQIGKLESVVADVTGQRDDLARQQKRIEDETASVVAKSESTNATIYSGTVTSPRELQAMQDEVAALARRQSQLEDQVLEFMEQIEPLNGQLAEHETQRGALDAQAVDLDNQIAAADAEIDTEAAEVAGERVTAAADLPETLLTEYEKLRKQFGGVGVAKLNGNTCTGCHLTLSAIEVDRIKKLDGDALVHCEECGRLLVQ